MFVFRSRMILCVSLCFMVYLHASQGAITRSRTCSNDKFTCDDGSCVAINTKCNGENDCYTDLSDETNCTCPVDWERFGQSCYKVHMEQRTWKQANMICYRGSVSSGLAEINDEQENQFLAGLITKNITYYQTFHIGATDDGYEGGWWWVNSDLPLYYSNWNPGEPLNDSGNEDCAVLAPNGGWNAIPCTYSHHPFICEINFQGMPWSESAK